jgi:hypothetical protein
MHDVGGDPAGEVQHGGGNDSGCSRCAATCPSAIYLGGKVARVHPQQDVKMALPAGQVDAGQVDALALAAACASSAQPRGTLPAPTSRQHDARRGRAREAEHARRPVRLLHQVAAPLRGGRRGRGRAGGNDQRPRLSELGHPVFFTLKKNPTT